jgi:hypothetical protein
MCEPIIGGADVAQPIPADVKTADHYATADDGAQITPPAVRRTPRVRHHRLQLRVAWCAIADRTALNQPDPMADQPLTTWDSLISR